MSDVATKKQYKTSSSGNKGGRPKKNLEPNSFRLPVKLSVRLKKFWRKFKPIVKTRVNVVIYALEDFMDKHDTEEKLIAFIESRKEKVSGQKVIRLGAGQQDAGQLPISVMTED